MMYSALPMIKHKKHHVFWILRSSSSLYVPLGRKKGLFLRPFARYSSQVHSLIRSLGIIISIAVFYSREDNYFQCNFGKLRGKIKHEFWLKMPLRNRYNERHFEQKQNQFSRTFSLYSSEKGNHHFLPYLILHSNINNYQLQLLHFC